MAYDEKLAERVRTILAERREVAEKMLMGTLAFMVQGALCCTVARNGRLLVRVTAEEREALLTEPFVSAMNLGGRTMKGFVSVAPQAFPTRAELAKWIERGIAAGASKRQKPRSRRA
jgi:TfoX/Sxy family transcriptional regulator of competence genes